MTIPTLPNNARARLTRRHTIGSGFFEVDNPAAFGSPSSGAPVRITALPQAVAYSPSLTLDQTSIFDCINIQGNLVYIDSFVEGTADQVFVPNDILEVRLTGGILDLLAQGSAGNLTLTGDVTGNGVGSVPTTLVPIGTSGTYTKVSTDAKGRVTSGGSLAQADLPSIAVPGTTMPRAVQVRFGERFDALDFAAVGDGVANDAPRIQAALDAAKLVGGGSVILPSGIYQIGTQANPTALYISSNVTLEGMGGTTILRRAAGVAVFPGQPLIANEVLRSGSGVTSNTGIRIRDLVIDGTQATGGTGNWQDYAASFELGIWLRSCFDSTISDVLIINHRRDGLVLEYCRDIALSNVICRGSLKCGIYLTASDHISAASCIAHENTFIDLELSTCWYCSLVGCQGHGSSSASLVAGRDTQYLSVVGGHYEGIAGIMEAPGGVNPFVADHPGAPSSYDGTTPFGVSNSVFSGGTIRVPGGIDGIALTGGGHNLVTGCRLHHIGGRGIVLWGSANNTILANKVTDVGEAGNPDARDGIVLTAQAPYTACDGNLIELNEISAPSGATMGRGINVGPGINGTRLRRNGITDATIADMLLDATSPVSQDDDPVLARLNAAGPLTGALVVSTPLVRSPTPTAVMVRITITGYFYDATAPFSIAVGMFLFVDSNVYNRGYINHGSNRLRVRTATDSNGKLAIILGDTTTVHSYPQLRVEAQIGWQIDYTAASGWALSVLSNLAGYTLDSPDVPDAQPTTNINITSHYGVISNDTDPGTGTITFDLSASDWHTVTLTGNRVLILVNGTIGQQFSIEITQDNSGSHTVTWFDTITWITAGGSAPQPQAAANKISTFTFKQIGSGTYRGWYTGSNA